jgi:hypothetical protein
MNQLKGCKNNYFCGNINITYILDEEFKSNFPIYPPIPENGIPLFLPQPDGLCFFPYVTGIVRAVPGTDFWREGH